MLPFLRGGKMLDWANVNKSELQLYEAIAKLLVNHEHLLNGLFNPTCQRLSDEPEALLKHYRSCLSPGEFILIRVSLDIWCSSGNARLAEVLDGLDDFNFNNFVSSLLILNRDRPSGSIF
jgi:hypothetical protein